MSKNRWVEHVRKFATDNNLSYGCALSKPECKETYRAKYGVSKKLTKKQNIENMGTQDFDAPNMKLIKEKNKPKKLKPKFIIQEEPEEMKEEPEIFMFKPKKSPKSVPEYNSDTDNMADREKLLNTFEIKTLRKFLKDKFNYVGSPNLTKKEIINNIILAEAGLPIKF